MVAVASEPLIPTEIEDFVTVLRAAGTLDAGALVFEQVPSAVLGEVFDDRTRDQRAADVFIDMTDTAAAALQTGRIDPRPEVTVQVTIDHDDLLAAHPAGARSTTSTKSSPTTVKPTSTR